MEHRGKFAAYYRVSTDRQGKSGLGLEAQKGTVQQYLNGGNWSLVEFVEAESGKHNSRPVLAEALAYCRKNRATLVVAKVDRLARNESFLMSIIDSKVKVAFCDLPQIEGPTGRFLLQSMANVAELEGGLISQRTKAALAALKARGKVLGGYRATRKDGRARIAPTVSDDARRAAVEALRAAAADRALDYAEVVESIRATGITSASGIARELNSRGVKAVRGGAWQAVQVQHLLRKLDA